jgi:tRNA threonylcarbamoyladenosine biosynthesis protein TsaB
VSLLGIDTSTRATSVCVLRDDGEPFDADPDPARLAEPPAHAAELLPAVAATMERAGVGWDGIEAVAVGIGPGAFTGLRIGIATARSLAHAREIELRPVSSLRALAEGIDAPLRLPLIDARRGELFAALYDGGDERWAPAAVTPEELAARLQADALTPLAAGDGSVRFRQALEAAGARVAPDDSPAHVVRGLHVCRLGARTRGVPPEAVLPEYLRAPDATPR